LIEGNLIKDSGIIILPLRVDLNDRPRQLICYEFGKKATTNWEVIKRNKDNTKIYFYPISGRTHQLRVHAAHTLGLNSPIIGDDLYGNKSKRLYLHADSLEFKHPLTNKKMKFNRAADF
jgi:tRNA pseudouridine32 synthase/23S rRNA pseudouridine746 synthase